MAASLGVVERLTTSLSISGGATVHLSPEKDLAGTVAATVRVARHPGMVYRPLMVMAHVNAAVAPVVTLNLDHGDGSDFDVEITSGTVASQQILFDLAGDFPGLLIFPKSGRVEPDALTIVFGTAAATAFVTMDVELLERTG